MNHFSKISLNFFLLFSILAESKVPLYFPAEKNNVQILPQKFEYSLRDQSKFLLGNRIIDTEQFKFDLVFEGQKPQLLISWPANVVQEGRILFTNPSGLSVWSQPISNSNSKLVLKDATTLVRALAGLSFFRFCVGYYDIDTGLDVCSPEIMIQGRGKNLSVSPRSLDRKPSVQINGRAVTHHGIVFLNDEKESLSFRAISRTGAEFKMDTRRIFLKFVDVQDIDEKSFLLTVEGPFPLAPSNVKRISENLWSVPLFKERAMIYVAGEGQVPLRQEFIVQGPLPTQNHRVHLKSSAGQRTYISNLSLLVEKGSAGNLVAIGTSSQVVPFGNNYLWSAKNVEKISYLGVQDEGLIFQAAYATLRQDSGRIEVSLNLQSDEFQFSALAEAQLWFERTFIDHPLTFQKVGMDFYFEQDLGSKNPISSLQLFFLYRKNSGLQLIDPSWYFGIGFQNWTFESKSNLTFAPRFGWAGTNFKKLPYFHWQEFDVRYSLPGKSSVFDLKSAWLARWKLYRDLNETQKLKLTIGLKSTDLEVAGQKAQSLSPLIEAGWIKTF
jgi:hypothetical protein